MALKTVTKRNQTQVPVDWTKVDGRLNYLNSKPYQLTCNASFVADRVREMDGDDGMATKMLDERACKVAEDFADRDPDFIILSMRIMVSNHHKNTHDCFSSTVEDCYRNRKTVGRGTSSRSEPAPLVNTKFYKFVQLHKNRLNRIIDYERDYTMTSFGYSTFISRYSLKRQGPQKQVEARPQDYALERMQDMWLRVACAIHMNRDNLADDTVLAAVEETYDLLSHGYIMHATPTLYNAGTPSEQLLSCYLVGGADSIEGIAKLEGDCKMLSKYSGGIGFWWPLRSSGSAVAGINGTSDGPEPFLRCMEASMKAVNQGGKRPGSAANYEQPAHPDIMRWLELRRENASNCIDKLFYALWIHDEFMHRVVRDEPWYFVDPNEHPSFYNMLGEEYSREYRRIIAAGEYTGEPVPARKVLMEACITQAEGGMPYMLFADAVNAKSNMKNTMVTRCSNLCVAGDTPILTEQGWVEIKTVQDQVLKVWNGSEWSDALVKKTSDSAKLYEIETSDGCILRCTPDHEWIIPTGARHQGVLKVAAKNLKIGQKLAKIPQLPVMDNGLVFPYAYTAGVFTGDGTYSSRGVAEQNCTFAAQVGKRYCGKHQMYESAGDVAAIKCQAVSNAKMPRIDLYADKQKLVGHLVYRGNARINGVRLSVDLPIDMPEKFTVPINYGLKSKLEWLAGLADTDGCISSGAIQIGSVNQDFLLDIKLMCQTMGINPIIRMMHEAGARELPDGRGGKRLYPCQRCYRLLISGWDTWKLYTELGFKTHRLKFDVVDKPNRDARGFVSIIKIEEMPDEEPTWCFGEPRRNLGMFCGILTGQCSEITIPSSPTEYGCCAISSLCLQRYVIDCDCAGEGKWVPGHVPGHQLGCNGRKRVDYDELAECAGVLVRNLNKITDINFYPVEEARRSQMRHRPLAIGVMGLADLFHVMRYPFTSPAARAENKRIFESIYYGGMRASMELAREHGTYETFLGDPINNPKNPSQPCPAAEGKLQFDLWGLTESDLMGYWDWTTLKAQIQEYGLRNSFITALPPTASTSQLQGCNEAFEPYTDNYYVRKTLSGENLVINQHLVRDIRELGLWSPSIRNQIVADRGSVHNLTLPPHAEWIREQYKTVWELDTRDLIDMDAERGPFIDQTQSSNRFVRTPTAKKLFAMHLRAWRKGLKTGNYYIRSQSESKPTQFSESIKPEIKEKEEEKTEEQALICMLKKKNGVMCYTCQ